MKNKRTNYFITSFTLLFFLTFSYSEVIGQTFYALSSGKLYFFKAGRPESATLINTIWNVLPGQRIVGMDFRPNTGELFALGYNGSTRQARLYTIDVISAKATPVGSANITLNLGDGNNVGFDFNPTVDRIRVIAANRMNYRLNPNNGAIAAEDGKLTYNSSDRNAGRIPKVVAGAYTNSYIGTTTTTLYDIEVNAGVLVSQIPPNDGVLNTVGSLGLSFNSNSVVDIDIPYDARYNSLVQSNPAYLVAGSRTGNASTLYWLNLSNGVTTALGTIGTGSVVEDIAILIERRVPQNLQGNLIYAVTTNNNLISFDSKNTEVIRSLVAISGIASGKTLVGTDFRPNTGELFSLGYNSTNGEARLYTINLQTGVATAVGTSDITLNLGSGPIGFDFNPTVDRIRAEGSNGKNYRLNPITGGIAATDGDLKFAPGDVNAGKTPFVGSVAYTNSFMGTTSTTLYVYDDKMNIIASQIPPNDGVLNTIGASGITLNSSDFTSDLDIYYDAIARTNTAYLSANNGTWDANYDSLYTVNLQTGIATSTGRIGFGIPVRDIAVFLTPTAVAPMRNDLIYAVTTDNRLISFNANRLDSIRSSATITGITMGQTLVGTDFRPNTGELFGLGYNSTNGEARLYTINLQTGAATAVGTAAVTLNLGAGPVGFDFNPTVDRIRVEGANQKNYRLNPITGGIAATDGDLKFATGDVNAGKTPAVGSVAYTNSFIGTTSTTLYVYDDQLNILASQIPPNDGVLNTIGMSGITQSITDVTSDLDITFDPMSGMNIAYLTLNTATNDVLYTINLQTGATAVVGQISTGVAIRDIAVFIDRTIPAMVEGQMIFGWTANNLLITFDSENPEIIRTSKPITGLPTGQLLVGMDFRPATGELWAMSYNRINGESTLFTLDTATAVLTSKSPTPFTLDLGINASALIFDFNPTVDRIRVMGENGRNYRLNPLTGGIAATDGNLKYKSGDANAFSTARIGTAAYTNSFNTTTTTTLYDYDVNLNILASQVPPNDGTLNTLGASGITLNPIDPTIDLDIFYDFSTMTNIAYLAANVDSSRNENLYSVNLETGAVTLIGRIGNGIPLANISVQLDSIVMTPMIQTPQIVRRSAAATFVAVPNPGRDELRIQLNEERSRDGFTVQIADLRGQIRMRQVEGTNNSGFIRWDASQMTPGMYLITVTYTDGRVETQQWMKQ